MPQELCTCDVCLEERRRIGLLCVVCGENQAEVYVGEDSMCRECAEHYRECIECGREFQEDYMFWDNDREAYLCVRCDRERTQNGAHVYSYSYSPSYRFYGEGPLYHGIELEVGWKAGDRYHYAPLVKKALGEYAFLKEDGSITSAHVNDGFEIVTHPASLSECAERLKAICDKRIDGLLSHDAGGGLGLHISVNRNALSKFEIARICTFMGGDRNRAFLIRIARRTSNEWAKIVKKDRIEDTLESDPYYGERIKVNQNRYEAVNLMNSSHIEFRLFRGTLKYSSLMLCIEFVNALCLWCKTKVDVSEYQSLKSLQTFVEAHSEDYPHLLPFMQQHI